MNPVKNLRYAGSKIGEAIKGTAKNVKKILRYPVDLLDKKMQRVNKARYDRNMKLLEAAGDNPEAYQKRMGKTNFSK